MNISKSLFFVLVIVLSFSAYGQNLIKAKGKSKNLVVFIHGYNGNDKDTWSNGSFYWPQEMHEDTDFLQSDIYVTNFQTTFCSGQGIKNIASELFQEIKKLNKFNKITFVAHSMGGLITREMIIDQYAYFKQHFSSSKTILNIIHLDTPNLGSEFARITALCSEQARDLVTNSDFLDTLNETWREKFLQRDSEQFFNFLTGYALNSFVVSKNSAIEFGQKTEMFQGGHSLIAKPASVEDKIYLWVKGQIVHENPWFYTPKTSRSEEAAANAYVENILEYSKQDPALLKRLMKLSLSEKISIHDFEEELESLVSNSNFSSFSKENP